MRFRTLVTLLITILPALGFTAQTHAEATVPLGHVEIRGFGPVPMVLISGPTLDWRYWEDFMDRNGEAYTMYAVTLPGMSGSKAMPMPPLWRPPERDDRRNPPLETPWLDNAVEAIVDMMFEHETGRSVIVGHGMGGLLAIRLGIEHPRLVSAVVTLEGPVALPTARPYTKKERAKDALWRFDHNMRSISPEDWPEQMAKWTSIVALTPEITDFVTRLSLDTDQEVCIRYMVEHYMTDLTDEIADLRVPTLGIFTLVTGKLGKRVNKDKKSQFGPAWHEEIRLYDADDISYFYALHEPERFDTEIAEFIGAQNINGAPEGDEPNPNDN